MTDLAYVQRMEAAVLKANAAIQKLRQENNELVTKNTALKLENDRLTILLSKYEKRPSIANSRNLSITSRM